MDSEIILCSGIKMDKNYENVLSYNEEAMVNLCRTHAIYTGNKYKIVGVRENIVNVSASYEECIYANYIAYKNRKYGNKWFFGWVTDVKLLNPNTTEITFKIDVFSTWYSRFNLNQVFIEREHVSDDTIGLHTIPEGLEIGDVVVSNKEEVLNNVSNFKICVALTDIPSQITIPSAGQNINKLYNGIYSGVYYVACESSNDATQLIKMYDELSMADAIYSIFMIPNLFCELETHTWTYDTFSADLRYIAYDTESSWIATGIIDRPDTIDTYTPINKKLFVWPYCYCNVTNNSGLTVPFKYEDSTSFNDVTNKTCLTFFLEGAITPGLSIKAIPQDYKGLSENYMYGIDLGKFPVCSWNSDVYVNWLTQNGTNATLNVLGSTIGAIGGLATGNPVAGAGGILGIFHSMHQFTEAKMTPDQARGNVNSGDINFAYSSSGGLSLYNMTIKKEMAKSIDSYFSRFGYKVNEVKTPNLNSRSKFNFIKVGGMDELVSGNIPATALEEINGIFRKGVTIFHNYNDIGNFTISNPII